MDGLSVLHLTFGHSYTFGFRGLTRWNGSRSSWPGLQLPRLWNLQR